MPIFLKDEEEIMKKSIGVSILLTMMLLVVFNLPAIAEAPIQPGGPFVPPNQEVNLSAIMTFDKRGQVLYT